MKETNTHLDRVIDRLDNVDGHLAVVESSFDKNPSKPENSEEVLCVDAPLQQEQVANQILLFNELSRYDCGFKNNDSTS